MNLGEAIEAMKNGKVMTRKGWLDKDLYIWYIPPETIKQGLCKDPRLKGDTCANFGEVECLGAICMKTTDNKVLMGWSASQVDMLSDDWIVYGEGKNEDESGDVWNYRGIRFFRANVDPVSFEDAEVNGYSEDEDSPQIPCINEDRRWDILIDIKDGKILNWKLGNYASVYYKAVDEGIYTAYDNNMRIVKEFEGYVPKLMDFDDNDGHYGFGDYVGLDIDKNGYIRKWPTGKHLEFFIDDFLSNEDDY